MSNSKVHAMLRIALPPILTVVAVLVVLGPYALGSQPALAQSVVWLRQFGSAGPDAATDLFANASGTLYVAGWAGAALPNQVYGGGSRDAFVRKYGPDGSELWTREFGTAATDDATAVAVDANGSVLVGGETRGGLTGTSPAGESDAFLRKYDANGVELWTRQFGASGAGPAGAAAVTSVGVSPTGDVYVGGWVFGVLPNQSGAGQHDAFVRKYSTTGTEAWTVQFGTSRNDRAAAMAVDATGDVSLVTVVDGTDLFVQQYDSGGAQLMTRQLTTSAEDRIASVKLDANGNTYLVGQTSHDQGTILVRKYDALGAESWTRQLGISERNVAADVVADAAGQVYVTGHTSDAAGLSQTQLYHAFLRKFDPNGGELLNLQLSSTRLDVAARVAADTEGNVYIGGWTSGAFPTQRLSGTSDAFIVKARFN